MTILCPWFLFALLFVDFLNQYTYQTTGLDIYM